MSTPTLKIKITPAPKLRGKMDVRFPANVEALSPIVLDKSGGTFTFSLDANALSAVQSVVAGSNVTIDNTDPRNPVVSASGAGDFSSNTSSSVDGEVVLFSGTGGKTGKRATGSGLAKLTSGVLGTATAGTDYYNPGGTDVAVADGGTGSSTASGARTNLGLGTAATQNTGTSGANVPLLNGANTWSTTQTYTLAPVFTDQSGSRTALGLGTAATQNTGTSGATVPFLNGTNTWANAQTFTAAPVFTNQSGSRTALGLGSAATQNTGTSGTTIPFLDGANVHSGAVEFSNSVKLTNTTAPTFANGVGSVYVSSTNGIIIRGQGSTNDITFMGASGGTAFSLPNGTSNISFPNAIQVATINNSANTVNLLIRSGTDTRLGNNNLYVADGGTVTIVPSTATPAGGSTNVRLVFGSTAGFGIYIGSGAPTVSAAQGSLYLRSDGSSTSTRLYVNTNGTTGWTNFTSAT